MHPFSDLQYQNKPEMTHVISRAEGVYIYDNDGRKILDGISDLWCVYAVLVVLYSSFWNLINNRVIVKSNERFN